MDKKEDCCENPVCNSSRKNSSDSTNSLPSVISLKSFNSINSLSSLTSYESFEQNLNEMNTMDVSSNLLFVRTNKKPIKKIPIPKYNIQKARKRDSYYEKKEESPNVNKWEEIIEKNLKLIRNSSESKDSKDSKDEPLEF